MLTIPFKEQNPKLNNNGFYEVGLKVSKQSATNNPLVKINHEFLCDEEANLCTTTYYTTVQHLEFDKKIIFADNTSVPIEGMVTIDDTNCPILGAEVCLKRKVGDDFINTEICSTTDKEGSYKISATMGTTVSLDVHYHDHSIIGKDSGIISNLTSGIQVKSGEFYYNYDFIDVEKTDLIVEVRKYNG